MAKKGGMGLTKTVIITGASSGIGFETTQELIKEGWRVFGVDINTKNFKNSKLLKQSSHFTQITCDLTSEHAVTQTMELIQKEVSSVDALIACAGVLRLGALSEMSVEDFDLVFNVNVRGLWLSVSRSMPMLKSAAKISGSARVILLSSVSALRPKIDSGAYSASKAAVSQLTRVLAVECAKDNILVNALAPGTVDTPMVRDQSSPEKQGNWRPSGPSPLGRSAVPSGKDTVNRF